MTALGFLSLGGGALLVYAGYTGQSAVQLVADTLAGGTDTQQDKQRAKREAAR